MNDFLTALALLTIIHIPSRGSEISARAFSYYPLIGLGLSLILAAANFLLRLVFPNTVAGALVVMLWTILTGALHLDGFADACDGLFAAAPPERRLEILRDVHLGAFGAVGLILLLLTKVAVTASIQTFAPLLLAPILGRWAMVYATVYPPARREGMAVLFRAGLTRREIMIATLFAGACAAAFGWLGFASLVGAFLIATLIARLALTRLGGLTGDVYGMICESIEVTTLLIGTAMLK
jgi:adenosylcobinamide-GDP ribazoletransferase